MWRKTEDFKSHPKKERYGLNPQVRRGAVSIPSIIATRNRIPPERLSFHYSAITGIPMSGQITYTARANTIMSKMLAGMP
ncbi:MAG: hypothetical protein JSV38_08870 [Desulfobacterales bacterium]|nr:MAG: hypothetical protein JSV38_08870 [Desulfobacterales bacterium]